MQKRTCTVDGHVSQESNTGSTAKPDLKIRIQPLASCLKLAIPIIDAISIFVFCDVAEQVVDTNIVLTHCSIEQRGSDAV